MGLFDWIGNAASAVGNTIASGLNDLSAIESHPIKSVKAIAQGNFGDVVQQTKNEGAVKTITNTVVNTGEAVAALSMGAAAIGAEAPAAITAAGSFFNEHILGTGIAAIAAPVVANIATSNPALTKAVVKQVAAVDPQQFGTDIGNATSDPSINNLKKVATDNPLLTAVTAGGLAYLGGSVVSNVVSDLTTYDNTRASKANTKEMMDSSTSDGSIQQTVPQNGVVTVQLMQPANPLPQQTNPVVTPNKKKTKKKTIKRRSSNKSHGNSKKRSGHGKGHIRQRRK